MSNWKTRIKSRSRNHVHSRLNDATSTDRYLRRSLRFEPLEDRSLLSTDLHLTGLGAGFEPTIIVNPQDPANVIAGQFNQLVMSTNYGATFPTVVNAQLPVGTFYSGFGGDPSLAFDSQGRLFWTYLVNRIDDPTTMGVNEAGRSIAVQQINPFATTSAAALVGNAVDIDLTFDQHNFDKQWIAADSNPASPFADNVYMVWSRLDGGTRVMFSRSLNGGVTWSAPADISTPNGGTGFVWPSHVAVGTNGDVYAAWHNNVPGDDQGNHNTVNSTITVVRDGMGGADLANADGGALNPVQDSSFQAAVSSNVQGGGQEIPNFISWLQGSNGPYILPDPVRPGNVYVVANDDPNDDFGNGDDGDVILARSTDFGNTWSFSQVSHGPAGSLQLMPIGTIDETGNIAVFWYDARSLATNAGGNLLLDVYASVSTDGGLTFSNDFQINEAAFDPDLNAGCRYGPMPPCAQGGYAQMTLRIGEYNGIAAAQGTVFVDWTGNFTNNLQEIFFDQFSMLGPFNDRFEPNDDLTSATILGSLQKITIQDATLDDDTDVDLFKYTAQDTGKLIANLFFNDGVADLGLRVRDRNDNIIASGTMSEIMPGLDVEGLVIPVVSQEEYWLEVRSVGSPNPIVYDLEIENFPVRAPFRVDLQAASDSGRSDNDDVTKDDTPTFDIYLDDADLTSMGFVRDDDFDIQVFNNGILLGGADYVSGRRWEFTAVAGDLAEGHNNFVSAAVLIRDRANPEATGRGEFSPDLQVTLDTVAPSGTVSLFPDSDTGIWGFDETMTDGVTGDMTPLLTGKTEANALVRVEIDDTPAGTTVAVPFDGDDAFPPPPEFDGNFFLQTIRNLSDGDHTLEVFFQDVAGNESPATGDATLTILVDTAGPKITNVTRGLVSTDNVFLFDGVTSLFEPKPSDTGPDPLVHSVVIHFSDLPDHPAAFAGVNALFEALAAEEGNYQLKGDHNGNIAIVDVNVTFTTIPDDGLPEVAKVELVLEIPLPDDRYTLWVSDSISDPAGNPLDGESGAHAPFEGNDVPDETPPIFPTGDGAHGGDFHARFTIDSRPEIGTYALGTTYLDINGNMVFDPEGKDRDYTNRDIVFVFGFRDDRVFAGNFAAAGAASATGYDKLGGYGTQGQGAAWHWRLDFNHDGVVDYDVLSGVQTQGDPVAGRFSVAHPGDEIGLFNAGKWWLDTGGDNNIGGAGDTQLQGNMRGQPIVGDFDGDGLDDLGTWNAGNAGQQFDGVFEFDLANNGLTGNIQKTIQFDLPGVFQFAVAADMNEDGIDDVGLFVTRREAVPPAEAGEWFFLLSDVSLKAVGEVTALRHPFTPVPFGNDLFAQYGDEAARPVVGNFDPPIKSALDINRRHNPLNGMDVNNDSVISPIDALLVINELNRPNRASASSGSRYQPPFWDVNDDSSVSPVDALLVINYLNAERAQVRFAVADRESVPARQSNVSSLDARTDGPASLSLGGLRSVGDLGLNAGRTSDRIAARTTASTVRDDGSTQLDRPMLGDIPVAVNIDRYFSRLNADTNVWPGQDTSTTDDELPGFLASDAGRPQISPGSAGNSGTWPIAFL